MYNQDGCDVLLMPEGETEMAAYHFIEKFHQKKQLYIKNNIYIYNFPRFGNMQRLFVSIYVYFFYSYPRREQSKMSASVNFVRIL